MMIIKRMTELKTPAMHKIRWGGNSPRSRRKKKRMVVCWNGTCHFSRGDRALTCRGTTHKARFVYSFVHKVPSKRVRESPCPL